MASVLGRDLAAEALERVLDRSPTQVLDALQEGLAARVIVEVPGSPGRFRFSHSLIRETLYEELATAERVRLHRTAGESLKALYASDEEPYLAELAHHFFEAAPGGDVDKAVDYARRGGERALALLAYEEAARLFRMALTALQRSPDEEVRCLLLLALGDALARAGETLAAQQTFLEAAATATRLNRPELLARAAVGYGGRFVFARAGTDPHLIPLLEQALAALGPGDSNVRVLVLSRLAGALRDQPSFERRDALSREAVDMARRIGDPEMLMHALSGRAGVTLRADGLDEQLALADELSRVAQEVGDRERLMDACWIRFAHFMVEGEVAEARAQLEMGSRLADEVGQPSQRWMANMLATCLALQDGRLTEAENLIEGTHQLGRGAEQWWAGASSLFALFVLRREQGRLAELEEDLRRAVEEYPSYRSFRCIVLVSLCEMGEVEGARRLFDRLAVDDFGGLPKDNEWLCNMTLLAEAADVLGERHRAATLYDLLSPYAGQVALVASDVSLGPVYRPLGILAFLADRHTAARRHFEASVAMCDRMGARPWLAHSLYQLGRLLAEGSAQDRESVVEHLVKAVEICEATGMTVLQDKVVELLAELGQGPHRPDGRPAPVHKLTPREREVVALIAEGLSNRQIAERLYLSERTVETHVQNTLMKLGFNSRTQVATWAVSEGLFEQGT